MPNNAQYELIGVRADGSETKLSAELLTFGQADSLRKRLTAAGECAAYKTLLIRSVRPRAGDAKPSVEGSGI